MIKLRWYIILILLIVSSCGKEAMEDTTPEPLQIVSSGGLLKNQLEGKLNGIYVEYNKPITVRELESNHPVCNPSITPTLSNDNKRVEFSCTCCELGETYTFFVSVEDENGHGLSQQFKVDFFESRLNLEGSVSDFLFLNDEKEILLSTFAPNQLLRYSVESNSIIETIEVGDLFSPMEIEYNPYNSKVYILAKEANTIYYGGNPSLSDVYMFDPETKEISFAFHVEGDDDDHPEYPVDVPQEIGFTSDGKGILLLYGQGTSGRKWRIVDSASDHVIYKYDGPDAVNMNNRDFRKLYSNYNYSKLYMVEEGPSQLGIFTSVSGNDLVELHSTNSDRGHEITTHKHNDQVYVRNLYSQFVTDFDLYSSYFSLLDSRHSGKADFSYRPFENNIIYLYESDSFVQALNSFNIIEYRPGFTNILFRTSALDDIEEFSSTKDGKYNFAIMRKGNNNPSYLYRFDSAKFSELIR